MGLLVKRSPLALLSAALLGAITLLIVCANGLSLFSKKNAHGYEKFLGPEITEPLLAIDFGEIEALLLEITFDQYGDLVANGNTESLLRQAMEHLPSESNSDVDSHLRMLINKGWKPNKAQQINQMISQYRRYYEAEQSLKSTFNNERAELTENKNEADLEQFLSIKTLRRQYFLPHTAKELFSEQELLKEFLIRRRLIKEDQSLSIEAKRAAIQHLERTLLNP